MNATLLCKFHGVEGDIAIGMSAYEWLNPFAATFLVSIVPIGFLLGIPLVSRFLNGTSSKMTARKSLSRKAESHTHGHGQESGLPLNAMMCFAAGSLLADSLDHLTEEAKTRDPHTVTAQVLIGIVAFFLIDRFSRLVHTHDHSSAHDQKARRALSVGYLSLVADAVHNFTDGLAIAASFSRSLRSGLSTTLAIFMHEIPHELGDYALLAKSGFAHAKIIHLQLMTAGAAFAGTAVGVSIESGWLGQGSGEQQWLLPVTCGGFLYLALCTIMSEVMGDEARNKSVRHLLVDTGALLLGIAVLQVFEHLF